MVRFLLALCVPALAHASPIQMGHQGRLLDTLGQPISGTHTVELSLRDASDAVLFEEDFGALNLTGGFYSVILGLEDDLDSSVLAEPAVYVAVRIDGTLLGSRSLLVSSPYAARATVGEHVDVVDTGGASTCDDPGRILYDTSIGALRVCSGTVWQSIGTKTVVNSPQGRQWSDGSVAASCEDYLNPAPGHQYIGQTGDGDYLIDVDGTGPLASATIDCDMTGGGFMVFHHDREARFRSNGGESPRSLQYAVTYTTPLDIIIAARDGASEVSQYVEKDCRGSVIVDTGGTSYTGWLYPPSSSASGGNWPNHTVCDINDDVWRESSGTVTNASVLPIIRIDNGDTGDSNEDSYFTLGPLRVR